jgi:dihydrofolate synthase / folylpolyglutamate synthase
MKIDEHKVLVNKLESLIGEIRFSSEQNLRLERISALLQALGNPQQKYRTIHVGGTSGKGSTSTYISNILIADNYNVGLFLSPYLQVVNEMFIVNGRMARTSWIW